MIVVSDTSCLSALIQTGQTELLPQLFGEVIIPEPVFRELQALSDFGVDVSLLSAAPWLKIMKATPNALLSGLLTNLDEGESHAIALSIELSAELLIIDERKGRKMAESLHLTYTGLGGVLLRAKALGLIPHVKEMLDRIEKEAGFFLSTNARAVILKAAGEVSDL